MAFIRGALGGQDSLGKAGRGIASSGFLPSLEER